MRVLVACLAVAALAMPSLTVPAGFGLVGSSGGHGGHEDRGLQSSRYQSSSSSSYKGRYNIAAAPSYHSGWPQNVHGLTSGSSQRTTTTTHHWEESEYTFSNGTHSTTITSKWSSEGVPEFHLRITRLRDGAVIESTVLSEYEYRRRRAELGLTGSSGSFGFESLETAHDLHDLRGRGHGLVGRSQKVTKRIFRESRFFSDDSHTIQITGQRSSDGVREYRLKLTRNSDGGVLAQGTLSEAEYNQRWKRYLDGESLIDVFDISSILGSGSRTKPVQESRYSLYFFSNGTHTARITRRSNSDGVEEYVLELIRVSDGAVLNQETISDAEYSRRWMASNGGESISSLFNIGSIRGSGSRTSNPIQEWRYSLFFFTNGSHTTRITGRRNGDGVREYVLELFHVSDGAVIANATIREAEYNRRWKRFLEGESLTYVFDISSIRGSHWHPSNSIQELHYSNFFFFYSNGNHTIRIIGRSNGYSIREYVLELIRDSDGVVLEHTTISEAEYNRRWKRFLGGESFSGVFDIGSIRGSGSRTSEFFQESRYSYFFFSNGTHATRINGRSNGEGLREYVLELLRVSDAAVLARTIICEAEYNRRLKAFNFGEGFNVFNVFNIHGSRSSESCSCVARSRCDLSERVLPVKAVRRCASGEVCCRRPKEDHRPLTQLPKPPRQPEPPRQNEQLVRAPADCSCVPRASCSRAERDWSIAGLEKCSHHSMVCCKRQLTERVSLIPTPAPTFFQWERDMRLKDKRDTIQRATGTSDAPARTQPDSNASQDYWSRYHGEHSVSGSHRRTEMTHREHSQTETSATHSRYSSLSTSGVQ